MAQLMHLHHHYYCYHQAMSFDKSPADVVLDCFHVRKQKAMQMTSTLHDSNRFMGEVWMMVVGCGAETCGAHNGAQRDHCAQVTISVAGMVRPGSESGKPVVMEW